MKMRWHPSHFMGLCRNSESVMAHLIICAKHRGHFAPGPPGAKAGGRPRRPEEAPRTPPVPLSARGHSFPGAFCPSSDPSALTSSSRRTASRPGAPRRAGSEGGGPVHAGFGRLWENSRVWATVGVFNTDNPMIKSLVTAAALTIGLAGYAFAQNTITGAPRWYRPGDPPPQAPPPRSQGLTPAPTGYLHVHHHVVHHHVHHHMHHHMAAPMAAPAEAPK